MTVNINPAFPKQGFDPPIKEISSVCADYTAATGSRDTVVTGPTDGAIITGIRFMAQGMNSTPNKLLIFVSDGTNVEPIDDVLVPASENTTSLESAAWKLDWVPPLGPFRLLSADLLLVAKFTAGSCNFTAMPFGGPLTA